MDIIISGSMSKTWLPTPGNVHVIVINIRLALHL